mmetsp:Transcript_23654/g.39035  ORF Transcript_23654/g.39035 Transcript_23654/m.39035 type:complete len:158 (-) Transcript_23654:99-572(-)
MCFSYDDAFRGRSDWGKLAAEVPTLIAATGCKFERFQNSSHGIVQKSGYVCTVQGDSLVLNTTQLLAKDVRIGFVSSPRTNAVAEFACLAGCSCVSRNISAFAKANTLLKEVTFHTSTVAKADRRQQHCIVKLSMKSQGEWFKFVSMTVFSRLFESV